MTALTLITFAVQHKYATAGVAGLLALNQVHSVWRMIFPRRIRVLDHRDVFAKEKAAYISEKGKREQEKFAMAQRRIGRTCSRRLARIIQIDSVSANQYTASVSLRVNGIRVNADGDDSCECPWPWWSWTFSVPGLDRRFVDLRAALIAAEEEAGKPQAAVCGTINSTVVTADWLKTYASAAPFDAYFNKITIRCIKCGASFSPGVGECPDCAKLTAAASGPREGEYA